MKTKNMTILHLRKSIGRSPLRLGFLLIGLALAWFALSPPAQAVTPPPDGGYPGFNTAEGDNALFSLTTGTNNTATGAVDRSGKIYPLIKIVSGEGIATLPEQKMAAIFKETVA